MDDPLERYLPELVMGDIGGALDPVKKGDVTACRKTPMSNVLQASQMNINVICNLTNNC